MTRTLGISAVVVAVGLSAACSSERVETEQQAVSGQTPQVVALATPNGPITAWAGEEVTAEAVGEVVPAPIDLPQFAGRENLMKAMGGAARRVGSANADDARAAAVAIGEYSLAARHPRFEPEGPEYDAFAIDLWRKNQVVQAALSPEGDASSLQQALRAQRDACQACHTAYRIEED